MKLKMIRFKDLPGKILIVLTVIAGILLSVAAVPWGITATYWTIEMQDHRFSMPQRTDQYSIGGKTYETLSLPEGVDRQSLKAQIDLADYDDIVRGDIDYLMFKDPLNTGDGAVLFVPIYRLGQDKEPFVLYVREVTEG